MKTFLGKIEAKIDVKGRVFVPSVFRKVFSEEDRERVVVRMEADEKYLVVYPESVWNRQVLDLQSKLNEWDSEDQMLLMQFVGDAEVLEFIVKPNSPATKHPISDMSLPEDVIIGGIVRGDRVFIATSSMQINAYDRVVVFAMPSAISEIGHYFN